MGAGTVQVVVSKHDQAIMSLSFDSEVITIGSDPDAHIYLPDTRVARQQAELRITEDGWVVEPLDHQHALILNAEVADTCAPVSSGSEIHLADFAVKVYIDADQNLAPTKTAVTEEVAKLRRHALPHGAVVRKERTIELAPDAQARVADFALRLSGCNDFEELLSTSAGALEEAFGARVVWIGVLRQARGELDFVDGKRKDGKATVDPPRLGTLLYRCVDLNQFIVMPCATDKGDVSALVVPLVVDQGCLGLIYVETSAGGAVPSDERRLDELTLCAGLIGRQLDSVIAGSVSQREAAVTGELSFIREIQARMDPATLPQWDHLQLAVYCKPGRERTGDLFDVMRLGNGLASFLVGHVEAATTRTALALTEIRTAFRMAAMHADAPRTLLRALNWMLCADRDQCLLQVAAIVVNPKTGACEYATAGNMGAMIVGRTGEPRGLADPSLKALGHGGACDLPARTERLAEGETLVLYSPGCRTITDGGGDRLGDGPLAGAFCDGCGQSATAALDEVLTDLSGFFSEGYPPDDIIMLLAHRR